MNEHQVIGFCLRMDITIEEYFYLRMVHRYCDGNPVELTSYEEMFPETCQRATDMLISHGYLETPYLLTSKGESLFGEEGSMGEQMGRELITNYPVTFPLSDGGSFMSRTGGDKEFLIGLYLDKIGKSNEKHKFVMTQLQRYIRLVNDKKINGHKLIDWISQEMWDDIAAIPEDQQKSKFKTDI